MVQILFGVIESRDREGITIRCLGGKIFRGTWQQSHRVFSRHKGHVTFGRFQRVSAKPDQQVAVEADGDRVIAWGFHQHGERIPRISDQPKTSEKPTRSAFAAAPPPQPLAVSPPPDFTPNMNHPRIQKFKQRYAGVSVPTTACH